MQQVDFSPQCFLEVSSEICEGGARSSAKHDVERLPVGPRQLAADECLEYLEELAIPDQEAAFVLERRYRRGECVGALSSGYALP
jgi:hypothetical protein